MSRFPGEVMAPPQPIPRHLSVSWVPPRLDTIKVNIDGIFLSMSNQSGIGGTFRDCEGNYVLHFAKQLVVDSTIHARIVAIRE